MSARVSLAQQIELLSQAAPTDLDPEQIHPHSDDDSHANNAAAKEHYLPVGPSALRRKNAALSDPKYSGIHTSRAELDADSQNISTTDDDSDELENSDEDISSQDGEQNSSGAEVNHQNHAAQSFLVDAGQEDTSPRGAVVADLASTLRATREQDRRKGRAVIRQLTLWDTLLDARIRLQKGLNSLCGTSSSQLEAAAFESSVSQSLDQMILEALALSEDITHLREALLRIDGTPNLSPSPRKRAKISHHDEHDNVSELRIASANASSFESTYHPHLIQTLAKWSAKIQAVTPNALLPANRSSFLRGKTATNPGLVEIIDTLLVSDAEKLLARTRTHQGGPAEDGSLDGSDNAKTTDPTVFDDTDFYQQLLRDVIESRGGGDGAGDQEWVRRQKARKARRKKTVDTRATKGRKLRYQVHEKLQNFMVPVRTSRGVWHDEQIDELFASLLGS